MYGLMDAMRRAVLLSLQPSQRNGEGIPIHVRHAALRAPCRRSRGTRSSVVDGARK